MNLANHTSTSRARRKRIQLHCLWGAYTVLWPRIPGTDHSGFLVPCAPVCRTVILTKLQKFHSTKFPPFRNSICFAVIHYHDITVKTRDHLQYLQNTSLLLRKTYYRKLQFSHNTNPELEFIRIGPPDVLARTWVSDKPPPSLTTTLQQFCFSYWYVYFLKLSKDKHH